MYINILIIILITNMIKALSPFEDYAIYSYGWALNLLNKEYLSYLPTCLNIDFLLPDNDANISLGMITDIVSYCTESFHLQLDSNYVVISYVICMHFIVSFMYDYWYIENGAARHIANSISIFVHDKIVVSYLGAAGTQYFPFILYIFYVILFGNLFGLIPSIFSITSNFSFTLFLSSTCWVGIFMIGLYVNGIHFFRLFYPTAVPFFLSPFLMFIEVISFTVRIASLSLRLFANIVAGHILIETVSSFFYATVATVNVSINIESLIGSLSLLGMVFILIIFESLIAFLQAYIFAVLVTIYLHEALNVHQHNE